VTRGAQAQVRDRRARAGLRQRSKPLWAGRQEGDRRRRWRPRAAAIALNAGASWSVAALCASDIAAHLAPMIGRTFQVSDTDLMSKRVRRVALHHALLSYVFGTVIVAITVSAVAGLLGQ
jgi:predicted phage gp36 major capsid-like protein